MTSQSDYVQGGCLCGAVRFEAVGEASRVGLCHCIDCRKSSGSAFNAFVVYPRAKVAVTGETGAFASSETAQRHFCRSCGSPVYRIENGSDEITLRLGCFDEPNRFRPSYEIWTGRREAWMPEIQDALQYERDRESAGQIES